MWFYAPQAVWWKMKKGRYFQQATFQIKPRHAAQFHALFNKFAFYPGPFVVLARNLKTQMERIT